MVITVFWVPSWHILVISISVLCVAVMSLLCCFWKNQKSVQLGNSNKKFTLSNTSLSKIMTFRRFDCNANEALSNHKQEKDTESELLDSGNAPGFDSSSLRIMDSDDDVQSCVSTDSRYTFYSTYPGFGRSRSNTAETFKSLKTPVSTKKTFLV